jgi:phosphatidyl-myo-inositol dimannoside synthase
MESGPLHLVLCDRPSPEAGGIQNMAWWIARTLASLGVRTIAAGAMDRGTAEELTRAGVACFPLRKPFRRKWATDPHLAILLLRLRAAYGRDVVLHSLLINNLGVFRLLRPLLGWRAVGYLHGNETLRMRARRPETLRRNILACDLVLANSRYTRGVAETLQPFPGLAVLSPGIPSPSLSPAPDPLYRESRGWAGRKVVLMLSRLQRRKGHATAIRAVARLRARHPEILLAIAGTGGERARIEELVAATGMGDHVRLVGRIPEEEKSSFFAAGDVYCMPSDEARESFEVEGFGITFLEAAAAGTLCVGSAAGGTPDALEDGASGLLTPPGDDRALAEILDRVLSSPREFDSMRAHARRRALDGFVWENRVAILLSRLASKTTAEQGGRR